MKRMKKGFTLIELLVVIAIIGILATTLAPKLREQLAKAKDSKAIAVLGAGRTAAEVLFVDKMVQSTGSSIGLVTHAEIYSKLDTKAQAVVATSGSAYQLTIGGSREAANDNTMKYGGTIDWAAVSVTSGDSIDLNFVGTGSSQGSAYVRSTEGKKWDEY